MMKRRVLGWTSVGAMAVLAIAGVASLGRPNGAGTQDREPMSAEGAVAAALKVTGLGGQEDLNASAERETLSPGDDVPFLGLSGRPVWRVKLQNVRILVRGPARGNEYQLPWHREAGGEILENPFIRGLDVVYDAEDGKLLKIVSPLPPGIDPASQPSPSQREEKMTRRYWVYEGLPEDVPKITFLEALQTAQEGLGGVSLAKQIEALHVLFRKTVPEEIAPVCPCRDAPCPRWFVTLRYLPPIGIRLGSRRPGPKDDEGRPRNVPVFEHCRHRIDPITGEWIGAGNVQ